jgi:hypothetical protein
MKSRISLALIVLSITGLLVFLAFRFGIVPSSFRSDVGMEKAAKSDARNSRDARSSNGWRTGQQGARGASSGARLRAAIAIADDLKALRDSLVNSTEFDSLDRAFYTTAIDEACYVVALREKWVSVDSKQYFLRKGPAVPDISNEVAQQMPRRAQAVEQLRKQDLTNACRGYAKTALDPNAILAAWDQAATAGDLRGAAMAADLRLRLQSKPMPEFADAKIPAGFDASILGAPPNPDAKHISALTSALSTQDPNVLRTLGPTVDQRYETGRFTFGDQNEVLSDSLRDAFWPMLACDFGADCGGSNPTVLYYCAVRSICDVSGLDELFRTHVLSAADVAQFERLRPLFVDAIRSGNWSFLRFSEAVPSRGGMSPVVQVRRVPTYLGR